MILPGYTGYEYLLCRRVVIFRVNRNFEISQLHCFPELVRRCMGGAFWHRIKNSPAIAYDEMGNPPYRISLVIVHMACEIRADIIL